MKTNLPTMEGKISNYDISKLTGLWATDVSIIAQRVGATEYNIIVSELNVERVVECYDLIDAFKIVDYVKTNPNVKAGGLHAPKVELRIYTDFDRAIKLMALQT